jgi:BirA family transcriptional regulator, biotin operon repressor / biotin---[acetyl-CoA-carboxylase] ligase
MKFYVTWYSRLPSTNTFLRELVALKPQTLSGTVVAAREQTQGRGRREREWLASANENLTFSLLIKGPCDPRKLPSASMAAAIAVAGELQARGLSAVLKWPNDVLVDGKKICGILAEGTADGVIIGIGLNVNMQQADHIDQPATSIRMETGKRTDIDGLLAGLLKRLSICLTEWEQGGFPAIRKSWEAGGPSVGEKVTVRDGESMRTGRLAGFGGHGELLLQDAAGTVTPVWAGDLFI